MTSLVLVLLLSTPAWAQTPAATAPAITLTLEESLRAALNRAPEVR